MIFSTHKRAHFDYEISDKYIAGIELLGFEVKSIKLGRADITNGYVVIRNNEAQLINAVIPSYQPKNMPTNYNESRSRRLLLNKKEIDTLIGATKQKGLTLIPLKLFSDKSKIKLEFGLAKHKKKHDKRETIKKRETQREMNMEFRSPT